MDDAAIVALIKSEGEATEKRLTVAIETGLTNLNSRLDAERAKVGKDWRAKIMSGHTDPSDPAYAEGKAALAFYRRSMIINAVVFSGAGTVLTWAVMKYLH